MKHLVTLLSFVMLWISTSVYCMTSQTGVQQDQRSAVSPFSDVEEELSEYEQQEIDAALRLSMDQKALEDSLRGSSQERGSQSASSSSSERVQTPAVLKKQVDGAISIITRLVREKNPLRALVICTHPQDDGLSIARTIALRSAFRARVISFSGQELPAIKALLVDQLRSSAPAREMIILDARVGLGVISESAWKKFYEELKELEGLFNYKRMITVLLNGETSSSQLFQVNQSLVLFPSQSLYTFESYAHGQGLDTYRSQGVQRLPHAPVVQKRVQSEVQPTLKEQINGTVTTIKGFIRSRNALKTLVICTDHQEDGKELVKTLAAQTGLLLRQVQFPGLDMWRDYERIQTHLVNLFKTSASMKELFVLDARQYSKVVSPQEWAELCRDLKELDLLSNHNRMFVLLMNSACVPQGTKKLQFVEHGAHNDGTAVSQDMSEASTSTHSSQRGLHGAPESFSTHGGGRHQPWYTDNQIVREFKVNLSLADHLNMILKSSSDSRHAKNPFRTLLIQGAPFHLGTTIARSLASRLGVKAVYLSLEKLAHLSKEDALTQVRTFLTQSRTAAEQRSGTACMCIIEANWGDMALPGSVPQITAHRQEKIDSLRAIIEECTRTLSKEYFFVLVAQDEEPLCDVWQRRADRQEGFILSLGGVETFSPQRMHTSVSTTSARSTAQERVSRLECPICFAEGITDMKTPCCKKEICKKCWNESLESMASVSNGTVIQRCPLCTQELKKN